MSSGPSLKPAPRRRSRRSLKIAAALLLLLIAAVALLASEIVREAAGDQVRPADAIVVFGAAEYAGRPSPVFRARLDHAYELFQRQAAPLVICTGGSGDDPHFTEGGVGRDYLLRRGIPDSQLVAETQGADTAQSAQRVAVILRANGMRHVIAVSDAYHIFRIKRLLGKEGISAQGAPRPGSWPRTLWGQTSAVGREVVSYVLWRAHLN